MKKTNKTTMETKNLIILLFIIYSITKINSNSCTWFYCYQNNRIYNYFDFICEVYQTKNLINKIIALIIILPIYTITFKIQFIFVIFWGLLAFNNKVSNALKKWYDSINNTNISNLILKLTIRAALNLPKSIKKIKIKKIPKILIINTIYTAAYGNIKFFINNLIIITILTSNILKNEKDLYNINDTLIETLIYYYDIK